MFFIMKKPLENNVRECSDRGEEYVRLDPANSIMDNLKGIKFFEFPQIEVVETVPADWKVVEKEEGLHNQGT